MAKFVTAMRANYVALAYGVAIVVLFAVSGLVIWKSDVLVFTGTDPSSKVVGAVLALVGVFLTCVVTLIGLLLKHSIDRRTNAIQRQTEDRLKLEASIQAIQLFATTEGKPSLPIQRAGALITLSSLGQHALTVTLLPPLLQSGEIDASTASDVLNRALLAEDSIARNDALAILMRYAEKFLSTSGAELPPCLFAPNTELSVFARSCTAIVAAKVLLARPIDEWRRHYGEALCGLVGEMCLAWHRETNEVLRNDLGAMLNAILLAFPKAIITVANGEVNCPELQKATAAMQARTVDAVKATTRLRAWAQVTRET